jgi:hypothetical protein
LLGGNFPGPTSDPALYAFRIGGTPTRDVLTQIGGLLGFGGDNEFTLNFEDQPGSSYLGKGVDGELWKEMASCDGLIFLFDPVREMDEPRGDRNYQYVQRTVGRLANAAATARSGWLEGGKVGQHLAVCLTKFDLPSVFERLVDGDLIDNPDSGDPPRVTDAKAAFRLFADRHTVSTIENTFFEKRVRYFVISSIGFFGAETGRFDRRDYINVEPGPSGEKLIRGEVVPINVFAPLLWVQKAAAEGK